MTIWLARLLADIGVMSAFGALLFHRAVCTTAPRWLARASAALGLLALALWLVLEAGAYGGGIADVALHTWFGHVTLARAALLLAAPALPGWAGVLAAGAAVVAGVGDGHAVAMGDDPWLVACEAAHLLAAGAWLGSLAPLALALRAGNLAAAYRFFRLGLVAVVALGITAPWQGYVLAGGFPGLIGTGYGAMLAVKLALFAGLLAFAARNRWRLMPGLPASRPVLVRGIALQGGVGLATIGVAAWIAQMAPGMHLQPWWPFTWRPDGFAFDEPALRDEVITGLAWVAAALVAFGAGFVWRLAWLAVPVALWLGLPHLDLLFVPAYPTSYYMEPDAPSAESIARGAALYPGLCAQCHGAEGHGDGPRAKSLPIPPADLTAEHLWDHADGELFWWLTDGMFAANGRQVMPGFGRELSEDDRWALIDFIRSRNPHRPAEGHKMHRMVM